jgi:hypothetical protein
MVPRPARSVPPVSRLHRRSLTPRQHAQDSCTVRCAKKTEPDHLLLEAGVFGFSEGVRVKLLPHWATFLAAGVDTATGNSQDSKRAPRSLS